jgi:Tfp pilus assembly protein PilF
MVFPVAFLLVLVLASLTLVRNRVWENGSVFYRAQVVSAPKSAKAHYAVARGVYHLGGDLDSARFHYERAVDILPNYPDAWNNLGMTFSDLGNVSASAQAYQTALKWHDGHVKARFNWAQLLQEQGQSERAVVMYERVLSRDATHVVACNNLAVLYIQAGQIDTAWALLERALRVDPNYKAAQVNQEKLRLLKGE